MGVLQRVVGGLLGAVGDRVVVHHVVGVLLGVVAVLVQALGVVVVAVLLQMVVAVL